MSFIPPQSSHGQSASWLSLANKESDAASLCPLREISPHSANHCIGSSILIPSACCELESDGILCLLSLQPASVAGSLSERHRRWQPTMTRWAHRTRCWEVPDMLNSREETHAAFCTMEDLYSRAVLVGYFVYRLRAYIAVPTEKARQLSDTANEAMQHVRQRQIRFRNQENLVECPAR